MKFSIDIGQHASNSRLNAAAESLNGIEIDDAPIGQACAAGELYEAAPSLTTP